MAICSFGDPSGRLTKPKREFWMTTGLEIKRFITISTSPSYYLKQNKTKMRFFCVKNIKWNIHWLLMHLKGCKEYQKIARQTLEPMPKKKKKKGKEKVRVGGLSLMIISTLLNAWEISFAKAGEGSDEVYAINLLKNVKNETNDSIEVPMQIDVTTLSCLFQLNVVRLLKYWTIKIVDTSSDEEADLMLFLSMLMAFMIVEVLLI